MHGETTAWGRRALRTGLLAWILVTAFVVLFGVNPYAAEANALQQHGALHRPDGAVGIVAHRGAAAEAPENTLAAVRVGIEQDVDFIEVDVRLTADGVPILMHDLTLARTTDGRGFVSGHTLAQIRGLDAGSWFSSEFAGERVPTLEEFLHELEPSRLRALVELKGAWSGERLSALTEMLGAHGLVDRVALQSFETDTLESLREVAPNAALILLTREWDEETVGRAAELQVSAIGARTKLYDEAPDLIARAQALGIGVLTYTLNKEERWQEADEQGIDFVVTDDPVGLAAWRQV